MGGDDVKTIKEMIDQDTFYMRMALDMAKRAEEIDEVPVGAVIVSGGVVIAKGYNQVEMLKDSTAHAEMIALTAAFQHLNSKFALDCTLYVTLEPCLMCAGALYWSRISRIVYGAPDPQLGMSAHQQAKAILHPKSEVTAGLMEFECAEILREYFRKKR